MCTGEGQTGTLGLFSSGVRGEDSSSWSPITEEGITGTQQWAMPLVYHYIINMMELRATMTWSWFWVSRRWWFVGDSWTHLSSCLTRSFIPPSTSGADRFVYTEKVGSLKSSHGAPHKRSWGSSLREKWVLDSITTTLADHDVSDDGHRIWSASS